MRFIWRSTLITVIMLGWIATYYHHPAGYIMSIVAAVMIVMSCVAEVIAEWSK